MGGGAREEKRYVRYQFKVVELAGTGGGRAGRRESAARGVGCRRSRAYMSGRKPGLRCGGVGRWALGHGPSPISESLLRGWSESVSEK